MYLLWIWMPQPILDMDAPRRRIRQSIIYVHTMELVAKVIRYFMMQTKRELCGIGYGVTVQIEM